MSLGISKQKDFGEYQELIKVSENEQGKKLVSARELYVGLGLDKSQWSRWYKKNIEQSEFFAEDVDWVGFDTMSSGNVTKDFAISLEFAKHIAMMARTKLSHKYRNYFIECEKVAHDPYAGLSQELKAIIKIDQKHQQLENRVSEIEENSALEPGEYGYIGKIISQRVHAVKKERGIPDSKVGELFKAINREVNEITGVRTRTQLRKKHFNEVVEFVLDWQPSRVTIIKINQMNMEL